MSDFAASVAIWHHKGNLWGVVRVTQNESEKFQPTVADYIQPETSYSGGLYDTWAEAFAAIGEALDESEARARDRRFQVSVLDEATREPVATIERGLTHEGATKLLDRLNSEGTTPYGIQPEV